MKLLQWFEEVEFIRNDDLCVTRECAGKREGCVTVHGSDRKGCFK
ncbi:hypothetical protein STRDD13_01109 [Streptococcus sp. DD13]|nr:hypothetical protein STRDD13_01109 [Streptococcus sp. DD13]